MMTYNIQSLIFIELFKVPKVFKGVSLEIVKLDASMLKTVKM